MPRLIPRPRSHVLLACAVLLVTGAAADARTPGRHHISQRRAERVALAKVRGGRVRSAQLQTVQGQEVWVVDVSQPGKPNGREVRAACLSLERVRAARNLTHAAGEGGGAASSQARW